MLAELEVCGRILAAVARKPRAFDFVVPALLHYAQIRHMYAHGGIWEEFVANLDATLVQDELAAVGS